MDNNLLNELQMFTGTEEYYKFNPIWKVVATDGAMFLAEKAKAFWLLDMVASMKAVPKCAKHDRLFCTLKVKNSEGVFTARDGNGVKLYSQELLYTDFPLPEITLYMFDNVILLPSEY